MTETAVHYLPAMTARPTARKAHKVTALLEGWSADPAEVTCPVCLERLESRPEGVPPGQTPGL